MIRWQPRGFRISNSLSAAPSAQTILPAIRSASHTSTSTSLITVRSNCFLSWTSVVEAALISRTLRQSCSTSSLR